MLIARAFWGMFASEARSETASFFLAPFKPFNIENICAGW